MTWNPPHFDAARQLLNAAVNVYWQQLQLRDLTFELHHTRDQMCDFHQLVTLAHLAQQHEDHQQCDTADARLSVELGGDQQATIGLAIVVSEAATHDPCSYLGRMNAPHPADPQCLLCRHINQRQPTLSLDVTGARERAWRVADCRATNRGAR